MSGILETDYLVVGAGAMGLAFADTLLKESDARIVIVDRHGQPGGHWGDAYSFVRLHQPSAFYGVNSTALGQGRIDTDGPNRGLYEASSADELLEYFAGVMQALVASGRVRYLPMTDFQGEDGPGGSGVYRCQSLLNGHRTRVQVRRKLVDATHTRTAVPSTHAPRYRVGAAVQLVTPNELPQLALDHPRYTVIGGGKTGMDACMWLLQSGVAPGRIRWVMPNDAWLIDRANVQPGDENLARFFGSLAAQFESIAGASSPDDLFDRLEASGQLLRLDPAVRPTRYRCATVSQGELAQLRRIRAVVRMGRVLSIDPAHLQLAQGTVGGMANELYIDCSANAIPVGASGPVFEGDRTIHLRYVRTCAPSFSAAMIAAVECLVPDAEKNAMCRPVPLPTDERSWLQMWAVTMANRQQWSRHARLMQWLGESRLDYGTSARDRVPAPVMQRYLSAVKAAVPRVPGLLQAFEQGKETAAA